MKRSKHNMKSKSGCNGRRAANAFFVVHHAVEMLSFSVADAQHGTAKIDVDKRRDPKLSMLLLSIVRNKK
jgi:hypothetical protein